MILSRGRQRSVGLRVPRIYNIYYYIYIIYANTRALQTHTHAHTLRVITNTHARTHARTAAQRCPGPVRPRRQY